MKKPLIKEIKGSLPGPTVAIFSGIHGNEKVGPFVVAELMEKLKIRKGKVFLVIANPDALAAEKRYINVNLNRIFSRKFKGKEPEYGIAAKLMDILDTSDALLDLHAYNDETGEPFVICSKKDLGLARIFDSKIVSFGWESGDGKTAATDEYMASQGKPGICLECGTVGEVKKNVSFTRRSIKNFLAHFGLLKETTKKGSSKKIYVQVKKSILASGRNYSFLRRYKTFQKLKQGEVFLVDGGKKYKAGKSDMIIFPRENKKAGEEICIIGTVVSVSKK
jgi:succinylglutamate desuccinylase